jgi:hypothetical protein
MYPKEITEKIVDLQSKGFTIEETIGYFRDEGLSHISEKTIRRHRKSQLAKEIVEEQARAQHRDISRSQQDAATLMKEHDKKMAYKFRALGMHYRNEFLKIMIPQRIEQKIEGTGQNWTVNINDNSKRTDVQSSPATT